MDTASKSTLQDEFGTHKDDSVVQQILERGTVVESEVSLLAWMLSLWIFSLVLRSLTIPIG